MERTAFVIDRRDNVATALSQLDPGTVRLVGDTAKSCLDISQEIPDGHKAALCFIRAGTPIIKYGITIGQATKDILPGSWVHIHCMKSLVDERSSHLDIHTGAPSDIEY